MVFTNEEGFDMLMVLGECRRNVRAAERMYAERYPQRARQSCNVFKRLARVQATGQLQPNHNRNRHIRRPVQDERSVDVIAAVVVNPHDSTRRIAKESGISQTTVCRILKGSKYHPYHINLHQQL